MAQSPGWPYSTPPHWADLIHTQPADPAAGANFLTAVPGNALWLLLSVRFRLLCSAVAGARDILLEFSTGLGIFLDCPSQPSALALSDFRCNFANFGAGVYGGLAGQVFGSIPSNTFLSQGHTIGSNIGGILAGDQISNINIVAYEWLLRNA